MNHDTYLSLLKAAVKSEDPGSRANWYALSEPIFKSQPLNEANDLIRIIAYEYSWMPRIPAIQPDEEQLQTLFELALKLKNGEITDENDRQHLISEFSAYINNSIIGASKVLHFIHDAVPIIDRRVILSWNRENPNHQLPKSLTRSDTNIEKYVTYWYQMEDWLRECRRKDRTLTMRHLEKALFEATLEQNDDWTVPGGLH